jgi:four helix bundle protein
VFRLTDERAVMARVSTYQRLMAWQKSMGLVECVYLASSSWPAEEKFGLTAQVRRAAVSILANIAEGSGRTGRAELRRFLSIAHGSLFEVQTHLEVARRLGMADHDAIESLLRDADEVSYIVRGFIRSVSPD